MIKRSVLAGFLIGIALVLLSIYPVLMMLTSSRFRAAGGGSAIRMLLLVLNSAAGLVVVAMIGSLAAIKSQVTDPAHGFKAGAISGLVVGVLFYTLMLAPTTAVIAAVQLWEGHVPSTQSPYPPNDLVFEFLDQATRAAFLRMAASLIIAGLWGGIEGTVVGWLRRRRSAPKPTLLEVIDSPQPRRRWFADHDEVWRAGLLAGLLGGLVIWLSLTVTFFDELKTTWPEIQTVVMENTDLITQLLFSDVLTNCLFPLFFMAVLGTGALAVMLLKDPPRRHLSRFQVVMVAVLPTAVMILLALLQMVYAVMAMARYGLVDFLQYAQTSNPQGDFYVDADGLQLLRRLARTPQAAIPFFYLVPVMLFVAIFLVVLFWFAPQAIFYGLTLPLIFRRPVDRAARLAKAVHNQPASLLPRLYGLYANNAKAVKILPHLALLLKERPAAQVAAAYHTLSSDGAGQAVSVIRRTLAGQEEWRWRVEVGELYRILEEGLAAKTLAQVTAIEPPPREITSTLPPLLARSCDGIGRVLDELTKVERVDDLSTKLIFLNSAQAALLDLRRTTDQGSAECRACATPYPEIALLHSLLDFWQGFVLTAIKDLQGRADVQARLLAQRTSFAPRVRQCIVVTNEGLNVAQNICLQVADGEGYQVVEGAEQQVDILGPGEGRELEFWLVPEGPRRLRLAWQLVFDDAVDVGRQVEFADAMELVQEQGDRPFQRIFPIPYVTGTPLRSEEMFVGRQDVFDFVREHLLGAFQNNVIVLHGQRRTGKTSILYRLQEVLAETHLAVLVDMQGKAARGTADFLYALSDDIAYNLENHDILVELPARSEYEKAPEFTFRSRFLRAVVGQLDKQSTPERNGAGKQSTPERSGAGKQSTPERSGAGGRNLLLMFDEFEELQKRVEDGRLEPEIFPFLRNLMQHEPRLDFLFSGTHKLEELGAEYWSILFNIAAYKRITFLDDDEVRRLATEPVAAFGLEYDPLALERIIQVTAGHPYFTQVVCHEMVAYHNEIERSYLTVTCVDQVLERIIERGEAHFKYIWAGATTGEQQVMLALADLLPDPDAAANPAQVEEELARKGYELSEEELKRALAHLQAKDILTRSGPQSRLYHFKIDLIRRWIGITRPAV